MLWPNINMSSRSRYTSQKQRFSEPGFKSFSQCVRYPVVVLSLWKVGIGLIWPLQSWTYMQSSPTHSQTYMWSPPAAPGLIGVSPGPTGVLRRDTPTECGCIHPGLCWRTLHVSPVLCWWSPPTHSNPSS